MGTVHGQLRCSWAGTAQPVPTPAITILSPGKHEFCRVRAVGKASPPLPWPWEKHLLLFQGSRDVLQVLITNVAALWGGVNPTEMSQLLSPWTLPSSPSSANLVFQARRAGKKQKLLLKRPISALFVQINQASARPWEGLCGSTRGSLATGCHPARPQAEGGRGIKWLIYIVICTGRDVRGTQPSSEHLSYLCFHLKGEEEGNESLGFSRVCFGVKAGTCCRKLEPPSHPQGAQPGLGPSSPTAACAIGGWSWAENHQHY